MVVPARPARMPGGIGQRPIAAGWPDALAKRMTADTSVSTSRRSALSVIASSAAVKS